MNHNQGNRGLTDENFPYYLLGSCIRQAIKDYKLFKRGYLRQKGSRGRPPRQHEEGMTYFESARDYLFNPNSLEYQLDYYGIDIDINVIRTAAEPDLNEWRSYD